MADTFKPLPGVHVLIVEDNEDSRYLLTDVLQYCGALVTTASSAREALAVLDHVVPDVLVCDIVLPGRNGYWLLSEIRKRPAARGGSLPALACTGYSDDHPADRLTTAGFQIHLRKPIDPWALSRAIATLARQSS